MPRLSVIMPVYNAEDTLAEAVDSVLSQSLEDLELICVDDGSTDGSLEILCEYEQRDPRVRVLTQENRHAGPARNKGLEAASGEYVHFLDADDRMLPYAYECLCDKAGEHDLDVLRCAAVDWDVERGCYVKKYRNSLSRLQRGDFNRLIGLEEGSPIYQTSVAPWAGIFRREFLMEHGIRFNDLLCVNDRSFFAAAITNAERMMICRDRAVFHRNSQGRSLVGGRAAHFDCQFSSIGQIISRMEADGVEPEVQQRILDQEFNDLFSWFAMLCDGSERGDAIEEQTARFVEGYEGPFAWMLLGKYRDAVKAMSQTGDAGLPADEEMPVEHGPCEQPKVSVVVPIYNVEDYLNEALDSLVKQTLDEMEFICVNDGSTDGSLAILEEYAALDKRIRVLDGPNGGYGCAMNRGIDAARGEYMGILEPDDFAPRDMYRDLYRKAVGSKADIVKADFYRFKTNPDGSLDKRIFHLAGGKSWYNRVLCPGDEQQTFRFVMNTWSGIYNLDFINRWHIRHNETPGASYQDNGFFFQTFCRAERVLFVDKPYYMNRRDNPGSSMSSTGKMYCVTEEYAFIERWLKEDPALWERFGRVFYAKKFSNFLVTYRRIAGGLQREYLRHLADEFRGPLEAGEVGEEFLTEGQSWRLHEIVADPDAYCDRVRVSVVMPVYNGEGYLREALDGVLSGNALQFEVICVDDGSTDGSAAILAEYAARDSRVRVLTQANAGAGAARNAGMQIARGEYLSFLDADDIFEPGMLERAYDRARVQDADMVVYRCDQYLEGTSEYDPTPWTIKRDLLPAEEPFAGADIVQDVFGAFIGWTWDKLFRADFVRGNGLCFQEQRTTNDALFTFSAILRAERITTMENVLVHRRIYEGSLSATREESWHCFHDALLALRQQLRDWGIYDWREQDFVNYSLHFSLWNLDTLRGPAYRELYDALKGGWLDDLGVTGRGADYFYRYDEYLQLERLLASTSDEYLFWRLDQVGGQRDALKRQLRVTRGELEDERGRRRKVWEERKRLDARLKETRGELKEERVLNRSLESENRKLEKRVGQQEAEIEDMASSTAWKAGRAITWLPRKVKDSLKG